MNGYDCLFPVALFAHTSPVAARLAQTILSAHSQHADPEQFLRSRFDLFLGCLWMHLERIRVVPSELMRSLFSHERTQYHLMRFQRQSRRLYCCHRSPPLFSTRPSTVGREADRAPLA